MPNTKTARTRDEVKAVVDEYIRDWQGLPKDCAIVESCPLTEFGIDSLEQVELIIDVEQTLDIRTADTWENKTVTVGDMIDNITKTQV